MGAQDHEKPEEAQVQGPANGRHPRRACCPLPQPQVMSSLNSLGTRLPAHGDPEDMALRSTVTAPATGTRSLPRFPFVPFVVLGLTISAVLQAEALVEAAAELRLHPGVVACSGLSVAAVFCWVIISTNSFAAQRPTESRPTETPTGSLSGFVVLCLAVAALLQAEQLVAAADIHLHPGVVACFVLSVAVLFNLAIYSIYFHVARRPARRLPMLLRPTVPAASVVRSPRPRVPSHSSFLHCYCPRRGSSSHSRPLPSSDWPNPSWSP